jgi:hypothetical protein
MTTRTSVSVKGAMEAEWPIATAPMGICISCGVDALAREGAVYEMQGQPLPVG